MRKKANIENLLPEFDPSKFIRAESRGFEAKSLLNIILGRPDSGLKKVEKILLLEKLIDKSGKPKIWCPRVPDTVSSLKFVSKNAEFYLKQTRLALAKSSMS